MFSKMDDDSNIYVLEYLCTLMYSNMYEYILHLEYQLTDAAAIRLFERVVL